MRGPFERLRRDGCLALALALAWSAPAAAQAGDKRAWDAYFANAAGAGYSVVSWIGTSNKLDRTAYIHNLTTRAMQVVQWEVFDCFNVTEAVCRVHVPGPAVPAGATVALFTLVQSTRRAPGKYQYRFRVRYTDVDSATASRQEFGYASEP